MAGEILEVHQINERLAELSALIFPEGLRLYYADVDEIREQDLNPQSMSKKMFDQLVANIENESALESAPLCVLVDGRIEMISGHHRLRAARAAGLRYVLVYLYDELPRDRILSKQLAHNQISGESDPELVKRVWDQISDVQAKFEAFVDPRELEVPDPVGFTQVDVDLDALGKVVAFAFLSTQARDIERFVEEIVPSGELDRMYLADRDAYDRWRAGVQRVREELEIVAVPTAVAKMVELAMLQLDAMGDTDLDPEAV